MAAAPHVRVPRDDVAPGPLRLARLTRGWRQEDLAARVGCSRRYVSLIEAGYVPAPHVQEAIAAALELPASEVFAGGAQATGNGAPTGREVSNAPQNGPDLDHADASDLAGTT